MKMNHESPGNEGDPRILASGLDPESTDFYEQFPQIPRHARYPEGIWQEVTRDGKLFILTGAACNAVMDEIEAELAAQSDAAEENGGLLLADDGTIFDPKTGADIGDTIREVDPELYVGLTALSELLNEQ